MKRSIAAGCLAWVAFCAHGQALDVLALHQRAEQAAPSVRLAAAARDEQAARWLAARAQLGPSLNAQWTQGGGSSNTTGQGALVFNQALLDVSAWHQSSAQAQRLQALGLQLDASAQALRQRSAQLFVQLHAARALSAVQQQLQSAFAQEAQRMAIRHREGLAAAVDWRQSQSFLTLANSQARGTAQQERALRQALVAHAGDATLLDAPLRPLQAQGLPPAWQDSRGDAPQLLAAQREREARANEQSAAERAHWPNLSLQAQAQRLQQGAQRNTNDWQLQLRIPLWDSGVRRAAAQTATARLQAADAELDALQRELAREQGTQTERLQAAREQHAAAVNGLQAAAQTVAAMRIGQEQGSRSTGDVLQAIQLDGQLRALAVQAQLDAWLAWIDALVAQGRFDNQALQQLNTALE